MSSDKGQVKILASAVIVAAIAIGVFFALRNGGGEDPEAWLAAWEEEAEMTGLTFLHPDYRTRDMGIHMKLHLEGELDGRAVQVWMLDKGLANDLAQWVAHAELTLARPVAPDGREATRILDRLEVGSLAEAGIDGRVLTVERDGTFAQPGELQDYLNELRSAVEDLEAL